MADFVQYARELAETSTPLAANASVLGAVFDQGDSSVSRQAGMSRFRAFASSDQAGTLYILQSRDNVTWFYTTSAAVTAGSDVATIGALSAVHPATVLESLISLRYVRGAYVNGGTLQTRFEFDSFVLAI